MNVKNGREISTSGQNNPISSDQNEEPDKPLSKDSKPIYLRAQGTGEVLVELDKVLLPSLSLRNLKLTKGAAFYRMDGTIKVAKDCPVHLNLAARYYYKVATFLYKTGLIVRIILKTFLGLELRDGPNLHKVVFARLDCM